MSNSKTADEPKKSTAKPSPKKASKTEIHRTSPAIETRPKPKPSKIVDGEDNLGGDDIFATDYQKSGRGGEDDYVDEASDDDDEEMAVEIPAPVKNSVGKKAANRDGGSSKNKSKESDSPSKNGRKRKSEVLRREDDDNDAYSDTPKKPVNKAPQKSTSKRPKSNKPEREESKNIQDIFDTIPTVRAPTPPTETKKFNFAQAAQHTQQPQGDGTKEIPVGAENCLAGLSFVFTGVLESLGREEGQSLVKRYGGKVTTAPSSKTTYVVLGGDAGPKKLETIRKFKLKTINEDGLYELIRRLPPNGGDGKAAEQHEAKKKQERERIKAMAAEIDQAEKKRTDNHPTAPTRTVPTSTGKNEPSPSIDDRLWTTKYAPSSLNMICGNRAPVEKLQSWLRNWRNSAKAHFKKPGKDGLGLYRTVLIHGPPGIGKTTAAHLVAQIEGYDVVERNASDTRSKKLLETGLRGVLDTTSLQGYFAEEGKKVESGKKNLVFIMDEVDGMSAGDRGGVGGLAAVAKKTNIPMILICNERRLPKMRPFDHVTYDLPFRRPTPDQIRARLSTICFREKMRIPPQVLDALIEGTHADIRQVINMLSTIKLDQKNIDYDKGKEMSKSWEKHVILKPWDIVGKILRPQMFSPSSKETLNDKIELYFNDHEFSYLMLQENYLKTSPSLANSYEGRERKFKLLELADNAAESISDGDLVDSMIHGSQQQWSLMPTHAVFSFVRPASFTAGNMMSQPGFTSWLGNNSKQGKIQCPPILFEVYCVAYFLPGKMARQVKEIQGHMRLRASGDRHEVRQHYLPSLWNMLVQKLQDEGKEAVEGVIDIMDSYYLTREDWDAIIELGLGPMSEDKVHIDSQSKATFTRLYNQRTHPVPFMKASTVVAPKKGSKEKPDLEDAINESDEGEEILGEEEVKDDDDSDLDLKKDKYVKLPKKTGKGTSTKKSAPKPKPKKGKKAAYDDEDEVIDDAPKTGGDRKGRKPRGKV